MKRVACMTAAMLAAMSGQAMAQVAVDGKIGTAPAEPYAQVWVQNQPTSFGDNVATFGSSGDPENVVKGLEFSIPVANIGAFASTFKVLAYISQGQSADISNQVFSDPPLSSTQGNFGWSRLVDFSTVAGTQHLTINPPVVTSAPVLDGTLDGGAPNPVSGAWANSRFWLNATYTTQGNSTSGTPGDANGSEFDVFHCVRFDNGTAGDLTDDVMYFFIGGNFHNYRRIGFFIDGSPTSGQPRMLFGNGNGGPGNFLFFNSAGDPNSAPANQKFGLRFDTGFAPEHLLIMNIGDSTNTTMFTDYAALADPVLDVPSGFDVASAPATVNYLGSIANFAADATTVVPAGGTNVIGMNAKFDNSNIIGVTNAPPGPRTPSVDLSDGSEIDSVYSYIDDAGTPGDTTDDVLNLLVAGNMESNFNKLVLFFDVVAGEGQVTLRGPGSSPINPDVEFNQLNRMGFGGASTGDPPVANPGLTFDSTFGADYFITFTNGNNGADIFCSAAAIRTGGRDEASGYPLDYSFNDGGAKSGNPVDAQADFAQIQDFDDSNDQNGPPPNGGLANIRTNGGPRLVKVAADAIRLGPVPADYFDGLSALEIAPGLNAIRVFNDNSNVAGVTGSDASAAGSVTTGVEYRIKLSEIGWDGASPILLAGFVASSDHSFMSNQVIGGLPGALAPNPGEVTLVDFNQYVGNQYISLFGLSCDSIDFNGDGIFPDNQDIVDFIEVFAGGTCPTGTCNDIDFNNDGIFPDNGDLVEFIDVFGGGSCG